MNDEPKSKLAVAPNQDIEDLAERAKSISEDEVKSTIDKLTAPQRDLLNRIGQSVQFGVEVQWAEGDEATAVELAALGLIELS